MAPLIVAPDAEALAVAAADFITERIEIAAASQTSVFMTLTGGRTPERLYSLLADPSRPWRGRIPWDRLQLLWSDERLVAPDHPDSNYGMAERALLRHIHLQPSQVHRMLGELPNASDAADAYDRELHAAFAAAGREPAADVTLLGIGEDAHIASIFPGSPLLQAPPDERLAKGVSPVHLNVGRITMTPRLLLASRSIVVLASGSAKAAAVQAAIDGAPDVTRVPAQLLRSAGVRVTWLLDAAAAALVSPAAPHG